MKRLLVDIDLSGSPVHHIAHMHEILWDFLMPFIFDIYHRKLIVPDPLYQTIKQEVERLGYEGRFK